MENPSKEPKRIEDQRLHDPPWRRLLLNKWRDYQWYVIAGLWIFVAILGYVGFYRYFNALGETRSPLNLLYNTMQLFVLEVGEVSGPVNWQLSIARVLAPVVTIFTTIQVIATVFYEQLQKMRVRFFNNHAVICGLGRKGMILSSEFCRLGYKVVAIDRGDDKSTLEQCRADGAIALVGNATDPEMLRKAQVEKAKYLISVCGDDETNTVVAANTHWLIKNRRRKVLPCLIHIVDLELSNLLQEREVYAWKGGNFRLEFFNIFESGARVLLNEYPAFNQNREEIIKPPPHMLIVGLGNMGQSLMINAASRWEPRFATTGERLHISFVDLQAEAKEELLYLRYPKLLEVAKLTALQLDICSPEFRQAEFLLGSEGTCEVTIIYVCMDDDSRGLSAAISLLKKTRDSRVPIIIRAVRESGLASLMLGEVGDDSGFDNLHIFSLLERTCRPSLLFNTINENLARAIHEEYIRVQKNLGQTLATNPSLVPWDDLSEELRESNRCQADHIGVKLRAVGYGIITLTDWTNETLEFLPEEVEIMAEMEHNRWVEERIICGWSYAPNPKDTEKKTSPYLIPWEELPEDIKEYDRENTRMLPDFLSRGGFQVYRS
jgi:hypothetical protein